MLKQLLVMMVGTASCSSLELPFRCPVHQERHYRAKAVCNKPSDYRCVWDANLKQFVEQCEGKDIQMKGHKLIFSGGITRWPCNNDRYQPFMHTTDENSLCVYTKSLCNEIGQVVYNDGSGLEDRTCRCNHTAGYKFVKHPKHKCYCKTVVEDCSCVLAMRPKDHYLGIDYKWRSVFDDYDWKSLSKCQEIKHCKPETSPEISLLKDHSADQKYSSSSKYMIIPVSIMLVVEIACFLLWMYLTKHSEVIEEKEEELRSHEIEISEKKNILKTQEEHIEAKEEELQSHEIEISEKKNILKTQEEHIEAKEEKLKKGIEDLESIFDREYLKKRLEGCEDQKLRFGVTGGTGVGKSTFINLLLDAKEGDKNFAKTGRGDTTRTVNLYRHPKCDRFTITDMPGYNSEEFTMKTILNLFSFSDFDYFLLFFQNELKDTDYQMAKLLLANKIPFSFVRTKLDLDIHEIEEKSEGTDKKMETEIAIRGLKERLKNELNERMQIETIQLFLISNFKDFFDRGDLIMLIKDIASILPEDKMELFLFFLPIFTPETIEMKYAELRKRVNAAALVAGATAALPVPLVDIAANFVIVEKEVKHYINVFGLDKDYVASVPGLKHEVFQKDRSNMDWKVYLSHGMAQFSKLGAAALLSQMDNLIPIVGSIIAGSSNYKLIGSYLQTHLDKLKEDALTVHRHFTSKNQ